MSALPVAWTSEELEPYLDLVRPWLDGAPIPMLGESGQSVTDRACQYDRDPLVIALLQVRREHGRAESGAELLSCNGRDARLDYLQELVDGYLYAWQCLIEAKSDSRYTWQERVRQVRGLLLSVARELHLEQRASR